jgi:hypothetical protein
MLNAVTSPKAARAIEVTFRTFLNAIEAEVSAGKIVHVILDTLSMISIDIN